MYDQNSSETNFWENTFLKFCAESDFESLQIFSSTFN